MANTYRSTFGEIDLTQLANDIASIERENTGADILNVLREQTDMKAYKQKLSRDLEESEKVLLDSFLSNTDSLLSLYSETKECESILNSMESTLGQFADSLRGVSDEIRQLQHKSEELSEQLKSRSETQEQLIGYIDSVIVSPDLVGIICDHEDCGSEKFLLAIEQLSNKLRAHAQLDQDLPAVSDSAPELQKLKTKAISRIRDFLAAKINALKQPKTNVQILQRNVLLKLRPLLKFLQETDEGVFLTEIAGMYTSTLSKLYLSQFKTYVQTLGRLQLEATASRTDLLGTLEGQQPEALDLVSRLKGASTSGVKGNVFSISGGRERVIKQDLEADCIVVAAENGASKFYPEALLRSHQKLLADTASSEFIFLMDFFNLSENPDSRQRMFDAVFDRTLSWLAEHVTATNVKESHDAVGLMLTVRILEYYQDVMINKRKIGVLDGYFEGLLGQARQRLRAAIEANTDSLRKIDVKKIAPLPAANAPFYVTRRFAEFVSAILLVKAEMVEDNHISLLVDAMVTAFEAFLSALSKRFSGQEQQFFSLNNIDLIVGILREHNAGATSVGTRYQEKMSMYVSVLVEERLRAHFGALIKLTTVCEKPGGIDKLSLQDCERTVLAFQQHWKADISALQKEIFEMFSNLSTATEILKNAMTQLLLYYTRFQKLVQLKVGSAPPPWTRQIVPSAVIMAEIKHVQALF